MSDQLLKNAWKIINAKWIVTTRQAIEFLEEIGYGGNDIYDMVPKEIISTTKIISRGPRKGMRKSTYFVRDLTADQKELIAFNMTGLSAVQLKLVHSFIKNEKGQTMFSLVLAADSESADDYKQQWYDVWKRDRWVLDNLPERYLPFVDTTVYGN